MGCHSIITVLLFVVGSLHAAKAEEATIPFSDFVLEGTNVNARAQVLDDKLHILIPQGNESATNLRLPDAVDLSAYRYLLSTVENTGPRTVVLRMAVRDSGSSNYWQWGHHTFGVLVLRPGETKPLVACLSGPRAEYDYLQDYFPGMTLLPGMFEFTFWRNLNAASVGGIQIRPIGADDDTDRTIVLTPFRGVLPISAPSEQSLIDESFFPFIDAYGQYSKLDWPDKIHTDEDLLAMRQKEEAWITGRGAKPDDWNQYGGWVNGPQLEATGHFRTEKYDGKWWFVDPEGRLFWSKGSTGVGMNLGGRTPIQPQQRRKFFIDVPDEDIVNDGKDLLIGRQIEGIKYADQVGEEWRDDLTMGRAWAFGLNTAGAWSSVRATNNNRIPYTVMLHPWSQMFRDNLMDPFHSDFKQRIGNSIMSRSVEAEDPWCVGFFINNELHWRQPLELGRHTLTHNPQQPAKQELIAQLQAKYGTIQNLNTAWERSYASWDALSESREEGTLNETCQQDLETFGNLFCDTFFRLISEAMQEHAPNKLYLGDRFNRNVNEAIRACARYADVVSFNKYEPGVEGLGLPSNSLDKPILIGEFCFVRGGRRHVSAEIGEAYDPDYRGRAYAQYVVGALANPSIVGTHWFQWGTQPVTGRGDGENYEQGFLDTSDTPYWGLAHYARSLAEHIYEIRLQGPSGFDYQPASGATTNLPPVFKEDTMERSLALVGEFYHDTIEDSAFDPEFDPITYSKVSGPAWLSVAADGTLSGTPASGDTGTNTWTVQVIDDLGGMDQATLMIVVKNPWEPQILVGGTILNGDFNAVTGTTVTFANTPAWHNTKADQYQVATRSDKSYDGTQNAVMHSNRGFGVNTGHTIVEGDTFDCSYVWKDDGSWVASSDQITVTLYVTHDHTITGTRTNLAVNHSGLRQVPNEYEFVSREKIYTTTASDAGKTLFAAIETDSSGWARVDNFVLIVNPATRYSQWASASGITGADARPDAILQPDGFTNLQKFAFGMDPTISQVRSLDFVINGNVTQTGTPKLIDFAAEGVSPDYRAVFLRRKDHLAAGLLYTVDFSADLAQWTTSPAAPTLLTNPGSVGELQAVSVPYPAMVPANGGADDLPPRFFRVGVDMEP
jgi:hypothetical protein